MFKLSTTTYDYGCNTEIYGLIRIATDDAGSYPWLFQRQIRECVTWLNQTSIFCVLVDCNHGFRVQRFSRVVRHYALA